MQAMQSDSSYLSIIVVGAGIGGLATAVALSRKGHHVTVLESKPALNEFGASLGIHPNGVRLIQSWGLEAEFDSAVTKSPYLEFRDALTNEVLGRFLQNAGNTSNIHHGAPMWIIHRADYQRLLADAASANGTKILFDANVLKVDVASERPRAVLGDGRILQADLIVGADGMRSAVRHSIPATAQTEPKKLFERCWRATVPKERMRDNPKLKWLLEEGNDMAWSTTGSYILSWAMPPDRLYDVVVCIREESDVPAGQWGVADNPKEITSRFQDYCPEARELLAQIDRCVKWTLAELDPLETCRSENGRVVLLGDAFHAMVPHSASGGNSAIEDAAVLAECVEWVYQRSRPLSDATKAYEAIRKPRVERMQAASREGYAIHTQREWCRQRMERQDDEGTIATHGG